MGDRVVRIVEVVTAAAVVVFVVMLFANDPTPPPPAVTTDGGAAATLDVAALYGQNCAGCHGGDGSGGVGPPLKAARVVERFPNPEDQASVVSGGRNSMPAFASRLSREEIDGIVLYTRTAL